MFRQPLPRMLIERLPFYYGWIVLAAVCCAGFSRQGPAVATLTIFVEPMTTEFGWSRTAISGAVSVGGLLAAIASPFLGPFLDRNGARVVLCVAVLSTGVTTLLLSQVHSLVAFYLLYCVARMNFAGPYDLGIYGAINNWFVTRRAFATSIASLAQSTGLVALPLMAHFAIERGGWRGGWLAVGCTVLIVGFVPAWLFMVRRPEDVGLVPDRHAPPPGTEAAIAPTRPEPVFTRAEAVRTPAFWLLCLFTALVFPVQAGISLHQAPHLIERGLDPTIAATVVSTFSLTSAISGFGVGFWPRRLGSRSALLLGAMGLGASAILMLAITTALDAYLAAAMFGAGIGALLTLLPIAWADYFGRRSFGAIRGVALTVQVLSQASGPLLSGVLRDITGDYDHSLIVFASLSFAAALAALLVRPPRPLIRGG